MIYTRKITTIIFISLLVLFVVIGINLGIQNNKIEKLEAAELPVVPIQKLPSLDDLEVTVLSVFDGNRKRYDYTLLIDWIALPPHVRPKQRYFNISIHDKYLYITSKEDTRKIKIADKGDFTLDRTMLEHEPYHNRLVVDVSDKNELIDILNRN